MILRCDSSAQPARIGPTMGRRACMRASGGSVALAGHHFVLAGSRGPALAH